jgi:hypothetical protein
MNKSRLCPVYGKRKTYPDQVLSSPSFLFNTGLGDVFYEQVGVRKKREAITAQRYLPTSYSSSSSIVMFELPTA